MRDAVGSSEGDCFVSDGDTDREDDGVTVILPVIETEVERDSSFVNVPTESVTLFETVGERVPRDRVPLFDRLNEALVVDDGVMLSEELCRFVDEGLTVSSLDSESDGDAVGSADGVTPLGVSEREFVRDRLFSSVLVVVYDGDAVTDRDTVSSSDEE